MTLTGSLQAVFALAFVLALIAAAALLARRFGLAGAATAGGQRRLAIVEMLALDNRRRLVLVRRDQVEHLVLIGPDGTCVVEPGIGRADAGAPPVAAAECRP
jgi:flagellar protein FliO/FliZ